jgi:hypothetical protein
MCTNNVHSTKLKTFTSPSPPPCPSSNVIFADSVDFKTSVKEVFTPKNFSPRYCKFKISAKPELNAKIILTIKGKGLYDTMINSLPTGVFDDGVFKREVG